MPQTDTDHATTNTTPVETQQRVLSMRVANKGRKVVEKNAKRLERLTVEYISVGDIKPNSYNPNRQSDHDFELLLRSIEEDGFTQPVVITQDNTIVDGEHRWRAAQAVGLTEIPAVRVNMTEEQMRISTIRHNRARGSHDVELEASVLRDLQSLGALDWAADSLMLDDTELNLLLKDVAAPEAMAGADYSDAWVPDKFSDEEAALIRNGDMTNGAKIMQGKGGDVVIAMTTDAIAQARRREELISQARNEQERLNARQQEDTFRLSLTFSNEEAKIVRQVMGSKPAERLMELCNAYLAGRQAEGMAPDTAKKEKPARAPKAGPMVDGPAAPKKKGKKETANA